METNAFPTLGAAVLYLNGFHHGKHLDRLNYLSRHHAWWITSTANNLWRNRDEPWAVDHEALLAFGLNELYVMSVNGEAKVH